MLGIAGAISPKVMFLTGSKVIARELLNKEKYLIKRSA
jgi:hypothetical protein